MCMLAFVCVLLYMRTSCRACMFLCLSYRICAHGVGYACACVLPIMHACVRVCMFTYTYGGLFSCYYVCVYVRMVIYMYICLGICMCVLLYLRMCTHVHVLSRIRVYGCCCRIIRVNALSYLRIFAYVCNCMCVTCSCANMINYKQQYAHIRKCT